jgi:hypothetical protein
MAFVHSPKIVTDGLVLALDAGNVKSYPGSGTTWLDKSGRGNNGTLINGPTFNSGNGGSIVFDGTNDYITLNNINSTYVSVSTWVMFNSFFVSNQGRNAAVCNSTGTNNGYLLYQSTEFPYNRLRFFVVTSSIIILASPTLLSANTWYNVTGTYDGGFIRLFLNGVLDSSISQTGIISPNPGPLLISRIWEPAYLQGLISSVQIYNRALTPSEVLQNYNATKGRFGL